MARPFHFCPLHRTALAAFCLLTLSSHAGAAAEPDDTGRVEVTGVATTARLGNGTRYELDAQQLAGRGVQTLDQALALLPGLNVRNGAEGIPRIDIRGLRTRQVRLLVDGVPFNAAADGQFDPTMIPVALVERIVLHAGPASVLYGEGGLAGTIEIVTRKGRGVPSGTLWAQGGDGPSGLGGAQVAGSAGDWNYALGAEVAEQDATPIAGDAPTSAVQPAGKRVNSDLRRQNALARVGWQPNDRLRVALQLTGTRDDRGSPPSAINDTADVFAQRPRYDRIENQETHSAQLSAQWQATPGMLWRGWVYALDAGQDERRYDNAALALLLDNTQRGGFDLQTDSRSEGAHLQVSFGALGPLSLSVAADTRRDSFQQAGRIRDVATTSGGSGGGSGGGKGGGSGSITTTYGIRKLDESHAARVESLAAELGWALTADTRVGAGAGWVRQGREAGDETGTLASLDLRHTLGPSLTLKASLARRARAPSISQLYDATSGNAALRLERSDVAELGLAWRTERLGAQANVFAQTVDGLIRNDDTTGRAANIDRVKFQGLELQGQWRAGEAWQVEPGYTYLHSRNVSAGAAFDTLAYTPEHKLTLDARWQALPALALGGSVQHVRGQVADSRTGTPQQVALPAYTVTGLWATGTAGPVQLTLRVDNLADRHYVTSYGFWQPGRTASLRLQVGF